MKGTFDQALLVLSLSAAWIMQKAFRARARTPLAFRLAPECCELARNVSDGAKRSLVTPVLNHTLRAFVIESRAQ